MNKKGFYTLRLTGLSRKRNDKIDPVKLTDVFLIEMYFTLLYIT